MPHRIIPFPDDTIPGFELARLEWEYPLSGSVLRDCRLELDEHVDVEGPPEEAFYASIEHDGGCFLKCESFSEFRRSTFALSPKQVKALRILFSQEIPKATDNQKDA